jgi:putative restriction endonuclease
VSRGNGLPRTTRVPLSAPLAERVKTNRIAEGAIREPGEPGCSKWANPGRFAGGPTSPIVEQDAVVLPRQELGAPQAFRRLLMVTFDDASVRSAAFAFLNDQTARLGEVLPWMVLRDEFVFRGERVPLVSMQGIFKPAVLADIPLTIRTAPEEDDKPRPYDDAMDSAGRLLYRYRGTDPRHPENVGLSLAMQRQVPLIYLFGVSKGRYMPVWPAFIVANDPGALTVTISIDSREVSAAPPEPGALVTAEPRRSYVTRITMQRVHQRAFSARVLAAYQNRCAMCRLAHPELLDAAHILPDGHPRGEPVIRNGLALCKLHHAAFDSHILGVRPDRIIEVRADILEEVDGPMLRHGLQEMGGRELSVPRSESSKPERERLEERYEMFRRAG